MDILNAGKRQNLPTLFVSYVLIFFTLPILRGKSTIIIWKNKSYCSAECKKIDETPGKKINTFHEEVLKLKNHVHKNNL